MPKKANEPVLNHMPKVKSTKELMDGIKADEAKKPKKPIVNPTPRLTPKSRKKKPGPYDGYTRQELIDMLKKKKVPRGPVKPRDVKTVASAVATQAGSSPKARAKAKSLLKGGTNYETEII